MDNPPAVASKGSAQAGFDLATMRSLGRKSQLGRVVFAAGFAAASLAIVPWQYSLAWIGVVLLWETVNPILLDGYVLRAPYRRGLTAYAAANFTGAIIFQALALRSLAEGTPLGVALGAVWLSGSFVNNFAYFGGHPRLLWTSLAPGVIVAIAGPLLANGLSWQAALTSALILASLLAARTYALDHRTVLAQLADRQIAMADLERKLSLAVEASGDGLFEMDFVAGMMRGDANLAALLGMPSGEAGWTLEAWRALIHPDDDAVLTDEFARHVSGETPHATLEVRVKDGGGGYRWLLSRGRLVERGPKGEPRFMVGTAIDISARKQLEKDLEDARDAAERANQAKSMFVANMSHEIRTPLNGVVGLAGALARTPLTPAQQEMVALIRSSGTVLDRLLTDVLDQAKVEAGQFELQLAPFHLRTEFDSAAELLRERAVEKGLAFDLIYGAATEGAFEGDAVRLRQIVTNLASNAIKFTETGFVRMSVDILALEGGEERLFVEVADSGIGIDPQVAGRLFERFSQADGSISRRFGGTGLGLAICRSLAELMGGEIDVESDPGRGSLFRLILPLRRLAAEDRAEDADIPDALEGLEGLEGLRVLLAEDHPVNQKVVQLILEPLGVALQIVADGQAALDAYSPAAFDLILMDMQMPVMDGITAIQSIRQREAAEGLAAMPIVMLTANASAEHLAVAARAGADGHLAKPVTPEGLVAGIVAVLAERRRPDAQDQLTA